MWELLSCLCLSQIPLINTYHICKKKHWKHLKFVKIDISDHINNYTENQVVKENNEFLFHWSRFQRVLREALAWKMSPKARIQTWIHQPTSLTWPFYLEFCHQQTCKKTYELAWIFFLPRSEAKFIRDFTLFDLGSVNSPAHHTITKSSVLIVKLSVCHQANKTYAHWIIGQHWSDLLFFLSYGQTLSSFLSLYHP